MSFLLDNHQTLYLLIICAHYRPITFKPVLLELGALQKKTSCANTTKTLLVKEFEILRKYEDS